MRRTFSLVCRVGGQIVFVFAAACPLAGADGPLFPTPLHLVRRVEDPVSNRVAQVDEYCAGNRIVTVDGYRSVIVDFDRQEVLDIDRAASTYSVASFDEIAAANALTAAADEKNASEWKTTPLGVNAHGAAFEIANDTTKVDVSIDPHFALTRRAFDALTGAAYPSRPSLQHAAIAHAAQRPASGVAIAQTSDAYGIPIEQAMTFAGANGERMTLHNTVVSITADLPPPDVLAIPAGARLVPSRAARLRKSIEELKDRPPHP